MSVDPSLADVYHVEVLSVAIFFALCSAGEKNDPSGPGTPQDRPEGTTVWGSRQGTRSLTRVLAPGVYSIRDLEFRYSKSSVLSVPHNNCVRALLTVACLLHWTSGRNDLQGKNLEKRVSWHAG